jgi:hypothetical protein
VCFYGSGLTSYCLPDQYAISVPGFFYVTDYGAKGNGRTSDTAAINAAIAACNASGGTLFFPPGAYLESATPTAITNRACNVQGSGRASTVEAASGVTGITLLKFAVPGFDQPEHNNYVRDLSFNCNSSNFTSGTGRQNTGEWLLDTLTVKHYDLNFTNCATAILMENSKYFEERNVFDVITLENNTNGFLLQQDPDDTETSFEHSSWSNIYFNTYADGDSVFHLTGGALFGGNIVTNLNGNFSTSGSSYLFLLEDSSDIAGTVIYAFPETNGGGTSYAFYGGTASIGPCNSDTAYGGCVGAMGYIQGVSKLFGGSFAVAAFKGPGPQVLGTLTTSSASSDRFRAPSIFPHGSFCYVTPTNAIAAAYSPQAWVSSYSWGSLVVTHPSGPTNAGGTLYVWCQ